MSPFQNSTCKPQLWTNVLQTTLQLSLASQQLLVHRYSRNELITIIVDSRPLTKRTNLIATRGTKWSPLGDNTRWSGKLGRWRRRRPEFQVIWASLFSTQSKTTHCDLKIFIKSHKIDATKFDQSFMQKKLSTPMKLHWRHAFKNHHKLTII